MLGVEVFRDKQGLGQKKRDEEKEGKGDEEEGEKDGQEEGAAENEAELDLENGNENGSSPKMDTGCQGMSSWGWREEAAADDWLNFY